MDDALRLVDGTHADPARVRAEVGPNLVERALDAGVEVVGMQVVQDQEVADDLVVCELSRRVVGPRVVSSTCSRPAP